MPRQLIASLLARHAADGETPLQPALLVLVVAANAAGAMIVEITAGRLLAPYFGASLYTWTTVIGVVLTGLAMGHWAGGRLADSFPQRRVALLGLACLAGALATVLVLPLIRLSAGLVEAAGAGPAFGVVLTGFAAFLVPSISAGLVQPIATTYALGNLGSAAGRIVGRMLAAGVAGAIVGTFLAGFVLIAQLGSAGSIWLVAAGNGLLAALILAAGGWRRTGVGLAALGGVMTLTGAGLPGFAVPCQVESAYYCINVHPGERVGEPGGRLLQLDALAHSLNHPDAARLAFSHLELIDELVRRRFGDERFRSFFIGGGGYTLPRAWLARHEENSVTVAEIDPLVTTVARERLWFAPGPRTRVLDQDARVALARDMVRQRFDVIVGDAFGDVAMPAHLVTDAFHALVRDRLDEDGFYILNVIDRATSQRLVRSIALTLGRRFDHVEIWAEEEEVGRDGWANFVVYAASRPSGLGSPFRRRVVQARSFVRLEGELDEAGPALFLTDDFAPVEHLLLGPRW